ncbi:carbohydrate ABC transporter permease [Paenibacillus sp. YN15]|uniref:carbohydrate ABC transporter permease n=1 Tax=Paenibacillus sp. YN15 TaxID=1742774 RepID=UPI000DCB95DE|nr:carbohydrate ABC transporter permease [Paenibacillus sp. YN15]RAV04991.1 ABC transporter permease [Paenibacillus sp. YN15]
MRDSFGDKVFYAINYTFLTLVALLCLVPIVNIAAVSISDPAAVMAGKVTIFPIGLNWDSYSALIEGTPIVRSFGNSVILTTVGVVLCLFFTVLAAYPLSRKGFYGRRFFSLAIVFTMMFGGGLIPSFMLIKSLGLVNSYGAIWLPGLVSVYNMLIMKNYFENLPEELEEAARMDGATEVLFIWKIVLPLSLPMLATIALFYGVGYWNAFMSILIYINDTDKHNLMVLVQNMVRSQSIMQSMNNLQPEDIANITPEGVKASGVIVLMVPMLLVYPFIQKYFVKGVMIGAIKG